MYSIAAKSNDPKRKSHFSLQAPTKDVPHVFHLRFIFLFFNFTYTQPQLEKRKVWRNGTIFYRKMGCHEATEVKYFPIRKCGMNIVHTIAKQSKIRRKRENFNILCRLERILSASLCWIFRLLPTRKTECWGCKDNVNWILKKIFLMKAI